jgi:hypothetical protein
LIDKVALSFVRPLESAITFPSSSSNRTPSISLASEYPYLSRTTLVISTSSDVLKVRVSKSDVPGRTIFLLSAALAVTARSPAFTTVGSSVDSLALQATGQSLYSPSASSNAQITFTSVSSHADGVSHSLLMSINITYPLTSFVDSALAI